MIITDPFRCDRPMCEEQHTTQNGWWVVVELKRPAIKMVEFTHATADEIKLGKHFCGQTHAVEHVSLLMGEMTAKSKAVPKKEAESCSGSSQPLKSASGLAGSAPASVDASESNPVSSKVQEL